MAGYNAAVGRGWRDVPVNRYFLQAKGVSNALGFGSDRGNEQFHSLAPGHTVREAAFNLQYNVHSGNEKLWGWPGGAAVVIVLGLLASRGGRRVPGAFLAGAAVLVAAYGLYWYHGECYGPRFYFVLLPVLIMLTLRGLGVVARVLDTTRLTVGMLAIPFMIVVHMPLYGSTFYHNTRGISSALRAEVQSPPARPAIVLLPNSSSHAYFSSSVTLNDLALANDVLYARDRDRHADIGRLHGAFPDRFIYAYAAGVWRPVAAPQDTAEED